MNRNCLSYWYPRINDVVPTPRTFVLTLSNELDILNVLDGQSSVCLEAVADILREAAYSMFKINQCFLRTGVFSGKHQWDRCCFVRDLSQIKNHMANIIEMSHLVDLLGLPCNTWVVRELLPREPRFKCFAYGNLPITREYRFFVENGNILGVIPYWPKDALQQGRPDNPDWRKYLDELHKQPPASCYQMAKAVSKKVKGVWSVDLMETEDGWFVIDMALASQSWGWDKIGKYGGNNE